ncbi:MAG: hypothetical protein JWN23_1876 [Rhodocyclales bacterium]|nr:hypothetical protein [Rhodocyclales bacterium]
MKTQSRILEKGNCPHCAAKQDWLRNGSSWRVR